MKNLLIACGLGLALAGRAGGQTGPFISPQVWLPDWEAGFTVVPDDPTDPNDFASIYIDTDGDDVFEIYPIVPTNLAENLNDVEFRASPDRQVLYARAFGDALSGCSGVVNENQLYFFRPVKDADTSGHLELIYTSAQCLRGPTPDDQGLYNLIGQTQRVAFVVEPKESSAAPTQRVIWIHLNATQDQDVATVLNADVTFVEFSPDGSTAFIQHGLAAPPSNPDYELVDLCPGSRLGDSLGQLLDLPAPAATAEVVESSPGSFAARVNHSSFAGGSQDFPLTPCAGPPGTERCCLPDGSCQSLPSGECTSQGGTSGGPGTDCTQPNCPPPDGTQACCFNGVCGNVDPTFCASINGTPQGPGSNCLNGNIVCPVTRLSITKSGPASAGQGCPFTYTLSYQNTGTEPANSVVVRDTLPANAVFVSASHGGGPVAGVITWNIGTVPVGASGQVTVTVAGFCTGSQYVLSNSNYRITATPGGTFTGAPIVHTTVEPPSTAGITVAVSSVPNPPAIQPLRSGDTVTHTVAITNSTAQDVCRAGFGVGAGNGQRLDAVVSAGGGTVDTSNPFNWVWTGALPGNATVDVVFTTVVLDCVPVSQTDGTLQQGFAIEVRHVCGPLLGSATGPPLVLQPPVLASVVSDLAPNPPLVLEDIAGSGDCGRQRIDFQLARPGQLARFSVEVENVYSTPQAGVSIDIPIPPGITVNDPPFVQPTDPAASYDSNARTIHWTGDLAALSGIVITFEGVADAAGACASVVSVSGTTQACQNQGQCCTPPIQGSLRVFKVPPPPAGPHVIGIDSIPDAAYHFGLWYLEPGVDTTFQSLFCLPNCLYGRIARSPTGQFWMSPGPPLAYFDPVTLDVRLFSAQDLQALGLDVLADVAVDPRDGTAVMSGFSPAQIPALVRYDPVTQQSAVIYEETTLGLIDDISIDSNGMVIDFDGSSRLRRFDPANPSLAVEYTVSNVAITGEGDLGPIDSVTTSLLNFSLDPGGDFVVAVFKHYFRAPATAYELVQLGRIERETGAYSVIVDLLVGYGTQGLPPSLVPMIPYVSAFGVVPVLSLAVDPAGSIYVGTGESPGRLHRVRHSCAGPVGEYLGDGGPLLLQALGIEHVASTLPPVPGDCDADGDLGLADMDRMSCCLTGPDAGPIPPECECSDLDNDADSDLRDFAEIQIAF